MQHVLMYIIISNFPNASTQAYSRWFIPIDHPGVVVAIQSLRKYFFKILTTDERLMDRLSHR